MKNKSLIFELHADLQLIAREVPCQRVIELLVQAPEAVETQNRPFFNLALVIDRSGSMNGDKLKYVQEAALHVINLLTEQDRLALVAYDNQVLPLSGSVAVTSQERDRLAALIRALKPGGMTNLSGGWLHGCQEVAETAQAVQETEGLWLNRVLLLTDGLANEGITDMEELGRHAAELQARGVSTSTFGVGVDFNEHLLEYMANQGGGSFYFIPHPGEIPAIFLREMKEMAAVTARELEVDLGIPAAIDVQVLGGWKHKRSHDQIRLSLGDLAASQRREVYLKLLVPPSESRPGFTLKGQANAMGESGSELAAQAEITLRYAPQAEVEATRPEKGLMERYSSVELAEATNEALKLERKGERQKAARLLDLTIQASAPYIPSEQEARYQKLSQRMQDGLDELDRKATHQTAYEERQRRQR